MSLLSFFFPIIRYFLLLGYFSISLFGDKDAFDRLLEMLQSPSFRLGGGSTKGFGKFKVLEILTQAISSPKDLESYESSLNTSNGHKITLSTHNQTEQHTIYTVRITPDDFFMFGSGFGDDDADQIPVVEKVIDYQIKGLSHNHILMPASSIKGAIAHRTTYHFNLQNRLFTGDNEAREVITDLFGEAKNSKKEIEGSRGKLLFSDLFKLDRGETKVFDHVAIDRFTSGGIDGALFQEKASTQQDGWEIEILLENSVDEPFIKAFEATLDDVCSGMLPLGGASTKGHGVFSGTWSKS